MSIKWSPIPCQRSIRAARLALETYGCDVKKETPDSLECTRSRHVGVFLGSGGEKVTVRVSPNGNDTRVQINTGKGVLGRLGKKNWSTPVFNELLKNLKDS